MSVKPIHVTATWRSTATIDVPEGVDRDELIALIHAGEASEEVMEEITTMGAELTDWEAS